MDTNELIANAKARFSHNSAKAYLKDKYESKLIVADQDGLWLANIEIINFLSTSSKDEVILIDTFGNPVKVNRSSLLEKLSSTYYSVMEEWYDSWKELERKK